MKTAPEGQEFIFCNGYSASTVKELIGQIRELSPEEFARHVNGAKNDFYDWMKNCVNETVAEDIKPVLSQKEMVGTLTGHHWHFNHKNKFGY